MSERPIEKTRLRGSDEWPFRLLMDDEILIEEARSRFIEDEPAGDSRGYLWKQALLVGLALILAASLVVVLFP